jgi:hypothetical protein
MFGAYGNHPVYMGDAALYNGNLETMNRLALGNLGNNKGLFYYNGNVIGL